MPDKPASASSSGRIGGEYGEMRGSSLDAQKLNNFLTEKVPAIKVPVDVKQFKVRPCASYLRDISF